MKNNTMEDILFEHTIQFDKNSYRDIWTSKETRRFRLAIHVLIGIALLFTKYTLILGVILLLLSVLDQKMKKVFGKTLRGMFESHKHLHQPLTFGLSKSRLWMHGETIDTSTSWSLLSSWQLTRGWLVLTPHGSSQLFFPVAELEDAGVFYQVLELADKHGNEFK
jgi:hypothetical protein